MARPGSTEPTAPRSFGQARSEPILYTCSCGHTFAAQVVKVLDAVADPAQAERATVGTLGSVHCSACKSSHIVEIPYAYHDERQKTCLLVLPTAFRHRELEERAAFLLSLAAAGVDVPAYVREHKVVFGSSGLKEALGALRSASDRKAELDVREAGLKEREDELAGRAAELTREAEEHATRIAELEQLSQELGARKKELDEKEADLGRRVKEVEGREAQTPEVPAVAGLVERTMSGDTTRTASVPLPARAKNPDDATNPVPRGQSPGPGMFGALGKLASDARKTDPDWGPLRAGGSDARDDAVDRWIESRADRSLVVDRGRVRLLARVAADRLEALLAGPLSMRVLLHRLPAYPIVVLALGRWGVDRDDAPEPLTYPLDLQRLEDRQVLGTLSTVFRAVFDLYDPDYLPVVHRDLDEPLAANVRWVLTAAEAHLASIPSARRSYESALAELQAPDFDRFGTRPVALEEDSFALLPSVAATKVALGIISHWTRKENEEYLVAIRSFPLDWWRRIRGRVISRAVEFGLAMLPPVIDVALEQGLARSRKDLLGRLLRAFVETVKAQRAQAEDKSGKTLASHAFDLEAADVLANWKTLVADCEQEGVPVEGEAGELASAALGRPMTPITSGVVGRPAENSVRTPRPITVQPRAASIFGGPSEGPSLGEVAARAAETQKTQPMVLPASRIQGVPELIPQTVSQEMTRPRPDLPKLDLNVLLELLDDTGLRRDVALEVCRRKEAFGCGPVFGALRRMTRGEAVRVLPAVVQFGERAVPHLVDGLRSRKAYLRQGCALALGVLKSADGIDPLCDLLLSEPTDVWREIARAIGEIGPGVVMSLAARVRDPLVRGEGVSAEARERLAPEARERIAWALAHVAARGGRGPIDTLAGGRDPVASGVAKRALELSLAARDNDAEVRGPNPPRDQTVNRAFSRRFFEAMNGGSSSANLRAAAGESSGTIPLDDSQIVEGDDESLGEEDILADR